MIGAWFHWRIQQFSRSYNDSSRGANLTLYSGVIFWGSYFNSKKEFKELFFRSKNDPDIEELKQPPKRSYPVPEIFTPLSELH